MKPPPFGYSRPESVAEALAVLAAQGEEGKVLAGGQSLVPLLSMRLASPSHLVDINRLTDLAYVRVTPPPEGSSKASAAPAREASQSGPAEGRDVLWTDEREARNERPSDEGRQRLKASAGPARGASQSGPAGGRGVAWTDEREARNERPSDEGRQRLKAPGGTASGASQYTQRGTSARATREGNVSQRPEAQRAERARVHVGALARHTQVLAAPAAAAAQPLLAQALRLVAHPAIRNRGTTVGSIVHADPSGEMTAVLALLGGTVRVASQEGERLIGADDFFLGPLESAVEPAELATEVSFPVLPPRAGTAFAEVSRRHGDYAVCGVAAVVHLGDDDRVAQARAAYLSVGPVPIVVDLTEAVAGLPADTTGFPAAGALAQAQIRPGSDIHATAAYRRHLAGVLTQRALREALGAARERGHDE